MNKFQLYACVIIMVLGQSLSTLAEKEQKKYYQTSECEKGYECKADDCGEQKRGYCKENECKKAWGCEKKGEECWVKKKKPECHYKNYVSPYQGKFHRVHDGLFRRDYRYPKECYPEEKKCYKECHPVRKKRCHVPRHNHKKHRCKPYKKCDDDAYCEKGYKNYRECSIGNAPDQ